MNVIASFGFKNSQESSFRDLFPSVPGFGDLRGEMVFAVDSAVKV